MKSEQKIRVAVLYGGCSVEHEISLQSAANVIQHLDSTLFEVIPIGIDKQGNWLLGKDVFYRSLENKKVPLLQNHSAWFTPAWVGKSISNLSNEPMQTISTLKANGGPLFDVVFPVVHGPLCEDGTLQGLLELANLPYVGCGVLASAIGMDKDVAKRLVSQMNMNVAPYITFKQDQWQKNPTFYTQQVTEKLSYPVFVKPVNTGSSIGISKVKTPNQLGAAITEAFKFDIKVMTEQALDIIELEIAVLESLEETSPIVSVVGEIKTHHEFYSYEAKYVDEEGAELLIPASISQDMQAKAQVMAKQIFLTLECEGMARIDLFLTKDRQQLYFNEINTIPGFTPISMYPKLMNATGISYSELLTHLVKLAIKRHQHKKQLHRSYL